MKSFLFKLMPDQLRNVLFVFDDENFLETLRNHARVLVRARVSYAEHTLSLLQAC